MPTFAYQARDESGRLVRGVLEADSSVSLADRLRKMGYLVTGIEETIGQFERLREFRLGRGVPQEQLLLAIVQLANLVEAGIAVVTSLQTVASQTPHQALRRALEAAAREIESGSALSQALRARPALFPRLLVGMVGSGEASGRLDAVLNRYAEFLEKDISLRRNIVNTLTYPALLLSATLLLVLFMVTFIVPLFAQLFDKAGIPLPGPTLFLRAAGLAVRHHGLLLVLLGAAGLTACRAALRPPAVRLRVDRFLLRIPVAGRMIHQTIVARLCRTLGTLVGAGLPILVSLETAEAVVGNQVFLQELRRVRSAVERGERIAATLAVGKVFAPDAIQMIRVGEETGRLEGMLERVADFYELRVNFALKQLTTLLEPLLLIVLGGIVAFVMASLFLPMFDLVKVLQKGGFR